MSKYEKLSNYKGIRKDTQNGRYLATKYIGGKEYSKKFTSLKEAANWRINFHPSVPEKTTERKTAESLAQRPSVKLNGEDLGYRFRDVWGLYKSLHLPSLERSSQAVYLSRESFFRPLMDFRMTELTAALLDRFMADHKREAVKTRSRRQNFDGDLKYLKALLNWYRENYDAMFMNPVLKRHRQAGLIRKVPKKSKKLRPEEVIAFFRELPPFWRDFAETQFYMGARVSETAGLQVDAIDLKEKEIRIQYVLVWSRSKQVEYLKDRPKNNEISYASMNPRLEEIIRRRLPEAENGYLFHRDGKPLCYREIQHRYNTALKKAGLSDRYGSTHIMRHSMGTITRRVTGSMDMAQAVTRHKDVRTAQQYAGLPTEANRKAVGDVFDYLDGLEATIETGKTGVDLTKPDHC